MNIINVKIKYSYLGNYEESSDSFVKIVFEGKNNAIYTTEKIQFSGADFLRDILNTLEVRSWEELPRKFARIRLNGDRVVAIGNLIEDKWIELEGK